MLNLFSTCPHPENVCIEHTGWSYLQHDSEHEDYIYMKQDGSRTKRLAS